MSRCLVVLVAAFSALAATGCGRADRGPGIRESVVPASFAIDDGRQWIDAMPDDRASTIERIAAAYARNQDAARESELLHLIEDGPSSDAARLAYLLLSHSYFRRGMYASAVANLDRWAKAFPNDDALKQDKEDIGQWRGLPDQIGQAPPKPFASTHGEARDFAAPVLINRTPANYLLDTGAWVSVMTAAEAKRGGLTIRDSGGTLGESSGKGVKFRTAIAKEVTVGPVTFRDVSFAILPDIEPWRSMPVGRGGILGVPILLGLECIRWTNAGAWTFGCTNESASPDAVSNLTFFKHHILLAAKFEDKRQFVALDTGAETTDLNLNFAREYATLIDRSGTKSKTDVAGAGGTATIESVTLPQVRANIGDIDVFLRPAHVTKQDNAAMGGKCCVGNIGLDLLLQTGTLAIDFRRMTLRLK